MYIIDRRCLGERWSILTLGAMEARREAFSQMLYRARFTDENGVAGPQGQGKEDKSTWKLYICGQEKTSEHSQSQQKTLLEGEKQGP